MPSPTADLCGFTATLAAADLPETVRAAVGQHVLDVAAGIFASLDVTEARAVRDLAGGSQAERVATVAMMAHAAESDPIHAGTTICAGLLAVPPALMFSRDGATAAAAIVAGYEVAIRIGEALGSSRLLAQGWWPTAVCGGAGAAAAAARAMGLDATRTRHAVSLALVQAGGLGTGGAEAPAARSLLAARTVRTGVEAAQAAARGLAGPAEPLTGARGFLGAFSVETDAGRLTAGLGERWKIAETSLKPWPCALQAMSALDALATLVERHRLSAGDISSITIGLPEAMRRIVGNPGIPGSRFAAAASLTFLAAVMATAGDVLPARMAGPNRRDAAVLEMMDRIAIVHDPALDARFPAAWPARVAVATPAGRFDEAVDVPRGHPDRPIPREETDRRFGAVSDGWLDDAAQRALSDATRDLAALNDLAAIVAPLTAAVFDGAARRDG